MHTGACKLHASHRPRCRWCSAMAAVLQGSPSCRYQSLLQACMPCGLPTSKRLSLQQDHWLLQDMSAQWS